MKSEKENPFIDMSGKEWRTSIDACHKNAPALIENDKE